MTKEAVIDALKTVQEPDLGKDIISLDMVKDLAIEGKKVFFRLQLTTPACPLKEVIQKRCEEAIHSRVDGNAVIDIQFSSSPHSFQKEAQGFLANVKNIIAIVSGKGGVGKSTVAVNFALALSARGAKVGLLDADIYGPSIPIMFGLRGERPKMTNIGEKGMIVPLEKFGIKLISIGFLVDEKNAVVWRGPMASSALRQFITDVYWDELDYLVVDMPPGTGDIHLTLSQTVPITGVVVVTTPQEVALADARKGIAMFGQSQLKAPIIGLVENMSYFTPEELPDHKYYIFGKGGGKRLADEFEIPFLGQIPIVQSIREGGDMGKPAMIGADPITAQAFDLVASNAIRCIAMTNAKLESERMVQVLA